jgi:hypothetical protein
MDLVWRLDRGVYFDGGGLVRPIRERIQKALSKKGLSAEVQYQRWETTATGRENGWSMVFDDYSEIKLFEKGVTDCNTDCLPASETLAWIAELPTCHKNKPVERVARMKKTEYRHIKDSAKIDADVAEFLKTKTITEIPAGVSGESQLGLTVDQRRAIVGLRS